ncbi:MAG: response regulator [Sulfitobacter sp.]|nr:response regulator [Sulfitobacter sp.]
MRILAVDDDPVILDLLKGSLGKNDQYDLTCCESGEDAKTLVRETDTPFDCFLLDIMLPGIDGIELCDWVRSFEGYNTTPIVMITASKDPELMGEAFNAGATDFLLKPVDGVELGARINSMAMLNDSLHRERAAQHSLDELSAAMQVCFEDSIALTQSDVTDIAALENDLLRLPAGVYAMSLFSIGVVGMRGVHQTVKPTQYRAHLEMVAQAAGEALKNKSVKIAYAGSGRFVGVMMGRGRLDTAVAVEEMTAALTDSWNAARTGTPLVPELTMDQVGDQRIWSGLSASDKLRDHLAKSDVMREVKQPPRGFSLFSSEPERAVA